MVLRVTDRQLLAGALLAFASGAGSSNTRKRFKVFGGAMSGNAVSLAIELGDGDWSWAGAYAFVIGCYLVGTACGALYLALPRAGPRPAFALLLAGIFVAIDAALVSGMPDGTDLQRALIASLVAIPLGSFNQVTMVRIGLQASALTSCLQGSVNLAIERAQHWYRNTAPPPMAHRSMLVPMIPVVFVLGALAGIGIEGAVAYSLTPIAPLFLIGLWATEESDATATAPPPTPPSLGPAAATEEAGYREIAPLAARSSLPPARSQPQPRLSFVLPL